VHASAIALGQLVLSVTQLVWRLTTRPAS
jgi:hypothetical protein